MSTPTSTASARRAARLASIQALYQMELTGEDAETVSEEFARFRFGREAEMLALGEPDEDFFRELVRGVPHRQEEIDGAITKCLASNWRLSRVDSILRAILRCGAFELIGRTDVPAKVVIDEYVELSHAFFSGDEPGFVNAALDKLAHRKRAAEFGEAPPDDEF
ncbi:MAG: transcription antitermination factor NusB [Alphaproteobacteria bacterium]|nr:transcription antitermination factor NusB [Alphaproteobacteria bacterium]MDE1985225.1 transcription antitermination factor NusB [Alphaproteobacteria bacterium]MDE2162564.1 transcription antitermination factor NusB [Alphaproteobacteria bacterium]MDE2264984.1 transcription antitermination factor NusB [Alphaproteobacteria bacterium]MDE2500776.1 transcription antitermination factor NusB [Alphaproteobacteria bacterium]